MSTQTTRCQAFNNTGRTAMFFHQCSTRATRQVTRTREAQFRTSTGSSNDWVRQEEGQVLDVCGGCANRLRRQGQAT